MEKKNIEAGWLIITGIVMLLPMIYGIINKAKLPERIAIHFGLDGTPNGWAPQWLVVYGLPLFMIIIQVIIYFSLNSDSAASLNKVWSSVLMLIVPVVEYVILAVIYTKL